MLTNEAGEASGPCWHSFMKSGAAGLGVETFGVVLVGLTPQTACRWDFENKGIGVQEKI